MLSQLLLPEFSCLPGHAGRVAAQLSIPLRAAPSFGLRSTFQGVEGAAQSGDFRPTSILSAPGAMASPVSCGVRPGFPGTVLVIPYLLEYFSK